MTKGEILVLRELKRGRNLLRQGIITASHPTTTTKEGMGFPGGSDCKESACNEGDPGSIPGSGITPGGGNGNPLQYSCLENSMDRGAWQATVHGVAKSRT